MILALSVLAALTATSANAADTLYSGGPIVTVDDRNPDAEAIVVRDGRIAFIGTRKAARPHYGCLTMPTACGWI